MKIEESVMDITGSLITEEPKKALCGLFKKNIDYNNWIEIFVEAGSFIAGYENPAKSKSNEYFNLVEDEQGELRSIVFGKDNMRKLAEHMFKVNDFDFEYELERCLDSFLGESGLSEDNRDACKKHFTGIVINDIKEKHPVIMGNSLIQRTNDMVFDIYNGVQQLGNLQNMNINKYIESKPLETDKIDAQKHNNRKINIGIAVKRVKWKLSNFKNGDFGFSECTKEQVLCMVEDWNSAMELYPGWFIIPCNVCTKLRYKTPYYLGKLLDGFNDEESMYITHEYIWRYETGMFSYDIYMQKQIYDVWKKYYLLMRDNNEKYIKEWFYVGRALLREFREDGNEKDHNYVWDKLNEWSYCIENGNIMLYMDKVKYSFSVYNMNEVRRLLQRMKIPDECYDIFLSCAGIKIECGNLDDAEILLENLISKLELYYSENHDNLINASDNYNKKQIYIDSVYAVALRLYVFLLQGIAFKKGEYEVYQEKINSIFDKIDNMSYCFDFNDIIDSASKSFLEWQTKKYGKKETFELNRDTINIIAGNTCCEEAYYLYRVLDLCSFPLICSNVTLIRNIEVPWFLALYEAWPQIALNLMLRCGASEIGKYIITRKSLINKDVSSITKEIRYLIQILEYCIDEFEDISVDLYSSVCDHIKNNIPEILIRYMGRCPEDIQIDVLYAVKKIMEKQNVSMDNHMDNFIYMIMQFVSEKNKAKMLEELLQMDIIEHKVMYGHLLSVDLFTWYFRKYEAKKYCRRTEKISDIVKFLLSDDGDDNYIWQTKIKRLYVLSEMDLLTSAEKGLFAKKVWSRVNPDTKLPDIPDWHAWVFLKFESNESLLPAVSIKDYILKQRLMLTFANEEGCTVSMGESTYLDEMNLLMKNIQNDFWAAADAEVIVKDVLDYWERLKVKISKSKKDTFVFKEYSKRVYKIINMLAGLYENITKGFSDEFFEKIRNFIIELEQYNFGASVFKILFEKEENMPVVIENIIEDMYDIDENIVVNALEASYNYMKKYPDNEWAGKLLENMVVILRTCKEPGLVSAINLIHNLVYIKNGLISEKVIKKIDKCLLLLEKYTRYADKEDMIIKHKALIRKSCKGLAYQIKDKYMEYGGLGIERWQAVCDEDEFADVKNEMI